METQPLLSVRNLRAEFRTRYGTVHAVNDVSLDIAAGQRLAVVGESGSGKSAMALALLRLLPTVGRITGGSVELEGTDLLRMSDKQLGQVRGKDAAMVFQDPMTSLNPVMTLRDQMLPPMLRHLGIRATEAEARAVELLDQVGIPDAAARLGQYPHELSGGMRQRALIALALSCRPKLIIADEPTTALDVTIQAQIVALLKRLSQETGTAVLFITHDFGLVARFAHQIAVMYAGRIVENGPARSVFANPQHAYTRALLRSIPSITGERSTRLVQIDGAPPNMRALGPGCAFQARCPVATAQCSEELPVLTQRFLGHSAACWVPAVEREEVLVAAG